MATCNTGSSLKETGKHHEDYHDQNIGCHFVPAKTNVEFQPTPYIHCSKYTQKCISQTRTWGTEEEGSDLDKAKSFIAPIQTINYWDRIKYKDVVVIPSLSFDPRELEKIDGIAHYEERLLFNLILLRQPERKVIFVTSLPLDSSIIEYYWKILPIRIPFCEIRHRLVLLSTYDSTPVSLTTKILRRPRLVIRIQKAIRDLKDACLTVFNCTKDEVQLSQLLGIPLMSSNYDASWWGTKAGSREIFTDSGVRCAPGIANCRDVTTLISRIADFWDQFPETERMVVKLNEGFSGEGNALLDLRPIKEKRRYCTPPWTQQQLMEELVLQLSNMRFQGEGECWESFKEKIPQMGCIAELFLEDTFSTPSFQGCTDVTGEVYALSTHEQVMGGPDGQVYKGCKFPANEAYRKKINELGMKVGKALAARGVSDHFSVDFVAIPNSDNSYELYALEINLRKGGTTHPMMTLILLCEGSYQLETGHYISSSGNTKHYVASDNLVDKRYKGLLPHDIMELFSEHQLHYSQDRQTGTVFHLMGCLSQYGKIGVTCIGNSAEEAQRIYEETVELLNNFADQTQQMLKQYMGN